MPAPTTRAPARERALPENFDELVRRAMTGAGGVQQLKKALEAPPAEPMGEPVAVLAPVVEPVAVQPPPPPPPVAEPPAPPPAPAPPAPAPPPAPDPLAELLAAATSAHAARHDPPAVRRALDEVEQALLAARAVVDTQPAEEAAVRLPAARHPFGLVVGAPPAGMETGRLAAALEVDLATARAAVLAGGARLTLRSPDREALERRAVELRRLGLRACVVARADLVAWGPAVGLVGLDGAHVWRMVEAPRWGEERPDPSQLPRGNPRVVGRVWLVVPGEVEEKRLRAPAAESRWQRGHYAAPNGAGGEARLSVVDVYTDAGLVRMVEGAVDPKGIGEGASSQRLAVKSFVESLATHWPEAHTEARRTVLATARPGNDRRSDGWPAWEEHSRACASLFGGGAPDSS